MEFSDVKQFFKEADDPLARDAFAWITGAMEVRGLIPIAGAQPTRKRRSDAGQARTIVEAAKNHLASAPNAAQPSLSGLPDESKVGA